MIIKLAVAHCFVLAFSLVNSDAGLPQSWPYWPAYEKTPLNEIRAQEWKAEDHVIDGWDWSLPPEVKPAPTGLLAVYRSSNIQRSLDKNLKSLDLP